MDKSTEYTLEPICPYCGNEESDAWEINFGGIDGETEHDCGSCGETYFVQRNAIITYTTKALSKGE